MEIFFVYLLVKRLEVVLLGKRREPGWYQVWAVATWIVFEFIGYVFGFAVYRYLVFSGLWVPPHPLNLLLIALFGLLGGSVGGALALLIARLLPPSPNAKVHANG